MSEADAASWSPESHAEVRKLARLLRAPPERFDYLEAVDPRDLRAFREQVTSAVFDAHRGVLQRLAGASRLVPPSVLAKIAERVFGPMLCARVAGLVDVSRGADVAARLPTGFLADVAAELDPRRASQIIAEIPASTVAAVAAELATRQDWISIGRFVGHVPTATASASLQVLDDVALLQTSVVMDNPDQIGDVLRLLSAQRRADLLHTAAQHELRPFAARLLAQLDGDARAPTADEPDSNSA